MQFDLDSKNREVKRFIGLFSVHEELRRLRQAIVLAQKNRNETGSESCFLDAQGIVIMYRKCFDVGNQRGARLADKDLNGATDDLIRLHEYLYFLGNKYVAHPETQMYEYNELEFIFDENGALIDIKIGQYYFPPLDDKELQSFLLLVDLLLRNIDTAIQAAKINIIDKYNAVSSKNISQISHHAN